MSENDKFYVVVNPFSGKNRKHHYYKKALAFLLSIRVDFEVIYTTQSKEASLRIQDAIGKGGRKIIVIGGDGTYNEIVQEVYSSELELAEFQFVFIPAGTGNDWHRTMFPNGFNLEYLDKIQDDHYYTVQDLGVVTYEHDKVVNKSCFINVAGTGFDVYVEQNYLSKAQKFGSLSYFLATIKGLLTYKNTQLHISISNKIIKSECFMVVVGIGQFFGGGMKVLPGALPNDGLLDVTIVKNMSKLSLFRTLPLIYSGKFIGLPKIENIRCNSLEISCPNETYFHVDGEIRGQLPIKIEILPAALKVFAPDIKVI